MFLLSPCVTVSFSMHEPIVCAGTVVITYKPLFNFLVFNISLNIKRTDLF